MAMVAWGKDREKGFSMTECIQWAGPKMKYAWYHENRALFGISVSKESRTTILH